MQQEDLKLKINKTIEEYNYLNSEDNPFPDCLTRWREFSEDCISLLNALNNIIKKVDHD